MNYAKDYPLGYTYFRNRLRTAFLKNREVTDPAAVQALIARGEFVAREIEALLHLRKYRSLKKSYYDSDAEADAEQRIRQIVAQLDVKQSSTSTTTTTTSSASSS